MDLSSAFGRVAKTSQRLFGASGNVSITPVGGSAANYDATVYREKIEWRQDDDSDRHQVITRMVILPPESTEIPIGSVFTVGSKTYTVEHTDRSPASGSQTLAGVRYSAASVSRPGYYE